jgi:uncharacterized protein
MEKVIVRYKVKAGKAEENEALIKGVYEQLHREGIFGLSYSTYKLEDGLSFIHIANYVGEGKAPLPGIEAFKDFSAKIKERCDELPVVTHVTEIGSYDFRLDSKMKILLIGATGNIGQRILNEALRRGYFVTAASRHAEALGHSDARLKVVKGDLLDEAALSSLITGYDVVISAISAGGSSTPEQFKRANDNLITALKSHPNQRVIVVGGAGNTEIAPGLRVVDSPIMDSLPEEWKPDIYAHKYVLDRYKESDLSWTYFSPARDIQAGERTGKYQLGSGNMVMDASGNSKISMEDYAAALVDEIGNRQYIKRQMSIGY